MEKERARCNTRDKVEGELCIIMLKEGIDSEPYAHLTVFTRRQNI